MAGKALVTGALGVTVLAVGGRLRPVTHRVVGRALSEDDTVAGYLAGALDAEQKRAGTVIAAGGSFLYAARWRTEPVLQGVVRS